MPGRLDLGPYSRRFFLHYISARHFPVLTPPKGRPFVGDSRGEHLAIPRGKYNTSIYVAIAFFGQVALTVSLFQWGLSWLLGPAGTSNLGIIFATIAAVLSTLLVHSDRWLSIEAFSSSYCSGIANLSLFYVPLVALVTTSSAACSPAIRIPVVCFYRTRLETST